MLNHYEHQKLAELREDELRRLAAKQWMRETVTGGKTAAAQSKGLVRRIQAVLAALFA
ncbi:hypothetical protein [Paenibacillus sp. GCM10023250]|uniref:hypothetical protein n=1 Tax=Paenibacillus sp. GCM10023250 TaxID=3252648 RepID=UPI003608B0F4